MFVECLLNARHYTRGWQTFSVKDQIADILGSVGHVVLLQLNIPTVSYSVKAAVHNTETNGCDHVPIKYYLRKQMVTGIWADSLNRQTLHYIMYFTY